ncbi:alkaline phosphatase D family protein [Thalassolituus sp. LLYu03]|uniref:alkaline phosphatase D family protein n=1 Tax=Thalassolituus sp. LLYu03 TaxID=3421656 RepID=UPI003D2AB6B8
MAITRRRFLTNTGAGLAGAGALGSSPISFAMSSTPVDDTINPGEFNYGVASGDPRSDRVILWTHFQPEVLLPVTVEWRVATDEAMTQVVRSGTFRTSDERDYTVKVDADGLTAGTQYFYQFHVQNKYSAVGRTRTAPEGDLAQARFAVVSCSSYAHGYFNVYRALANRNDLDAVLHLGDYIYEYGQNEYDEILLRSKRPLAPSHEITTLSDYRRRHAYYKLDDDLQAVHQRHAFITVWDDHEFANDSNAYGAENHNDGEGDWNDRKAAAKQAYFEWMPIRENSDGSITRTLSYGNLLDLLMLDTRIEGRMLPPSGADKQTEAKDSNRTLLGFEQEAWLHNQLQTSTAQWKILGQQVMIAQRYFINLPDYFGGGASLWLDSWDGYAASRDRLLALIRQQAIQNVVVLTGDVHSSFASDLSDDPYDHDNYNRYTGEGSLAVEFVTPSVTSPGFPPVIAETGAATIMGASPHIKFAELRQHGFILLTVNQQMTQADWYYVPQVLSPSADSFYAKSYRTLSGDNRLRQADSPA